MKRIFCLLLVLLLAGAGFAEETPDFLELTGLSVMFLSLEDGLKVESVSYYDNAYSLENRDFTVTDETQIEFILEAVKQIKVVGPSDVFITDWYPLIVFTLSDGSEYFIRFDWDMLEVDSVNYELSDDAQLWEAINEIYFSIRYQSETEGR